MGRLKPSPLFRVLWDSRMESGWLTFSGHHTQPRLCCKPKDLLFRNELWYYLKLGRQYAGDPSNLYLCLFFSYNEIVWANRAGLWLASMRTWVWYLEPRLRGKKSWSVNMHIIPVLGRWRQVDLWTSLASQTSLGQMVAEEQQLVFSMTTPTFMYTTHMNMHAYTHASIYTGTHVNITHTYKHMHLYWYTHKHAHTCASEQVHTWTFIHIETHNESTQWHKHEHVSVQPMHSEIFF